MHNDDDINGETTYKSNYKRPKMVPNLTNGATQRYDNEAGVEAKIIESKSREAWKSTGSPIS